MPYHRSTISIDFHNYGVDTCASQMRSLKQRSNPKTRATMPDRDPLKRFSDAYANFQTALYEVYYPSDANNRLDEVRRKFAGASSDANQQFEALRAFSELVNDVTNRQRISDGAKKAYEGFVAEVGKAFSEVDSP